MELHDLSDVQAILFVVHNFSLLFISLNSLFVCLLIKRFKDSTLLSVSVLKY